MHLYYKDIWIKKQGQRKAFFTAPKSRPQMVRGSPHSHKYRALKLLSSTFYQNGAHLVKHILLLFLWRQTRVRYNPIHCA